MNLVNELDPKPDTALPPLDDEAIGRLVEASGRRPPIPQEDLAAIAAAASAQWRARTPARARFPVLALAAAVLAIAAGLALWWSVRDGAPAPAVVAAIEAVTGEVRLEVAGETRSVAIGEPVPGAAVLRTGGSGAGAPARAALRLASGTLVRLDVSTALRLADDRRLELLSGALYADVDSRAGASALEVSTALGVARDVGTRFMVRLDEGSLHVLVREGAVAVDRDGRSHLAAAGRELVVHDDGSTDERAAPRYGSAWDWVMEAAPPWSVVGRSVAEVLEWTSRETGWTVRYQDGALEAAAAEIPMLGGGADLGKVRADQTPLLLPGANLEGVVEDGVLTVRRAR
jgi:ferric-dicitrate binding protein FerR (iron transport regulator)